MALIDCFECKKQISDKAAACPHCGAPVAAAPSPIPEPAKQLEPVAIVEPPKKRGTHPITWVVLVAILAGVIWWFPNAQREVNLPNLPVEVATRAALTGPGLVLVVKNTSAKYLTFFVTLKNPTTGEESSYRLDTSPDGEAEVGHKEGWALASGDIIKITNSAYKNWAGSVP